MRIFLIPKVAILMGCYNGARYIREQLDSLQAQEHSNWCLYVSDDGSTDGTLDILNEYERRWGKNKLVILKGPQKGFSANFLTLVCNPNINANYYAFCDQDDVWLPRKLTVAVEYLNKQDLSTPQAYGGRTIYTDVLMREIGLSQKFDYPRSFGNALVQSIAGGNTMMFNEKAKLVLQQIGVVSVVSHDWWLYIVIEGIGGNLYFDPNPYVLYRQHPSALMGANTSLRGQFKRIFLLFKGLYKKWNDDNLMALFSIKHMLKPQNAETLELFIRLRNSSLQHRIKMLNICGLYRQGLYGRVSLLVAAIFKKL